MISSAITPPPFAFSQPFFSTAPPAVAVDSASPTRLLSPLRHSQSWGPIAYSAREHSWSRSPACSAQSSPPSPFAAHSQPPSHLQLPLHLQLPAPAADLIAQSAPATPKHIRVPPPSPAAIVPLYIPTNHSALA